MNTLMNIKILAMLTKNIMVMTMITSEMTIIMKMLNIIVHEEI